MNSFVKTKSGLVKVIISLDYFETGFGTDNTNADGKWRQ